MDSLRIKGERDVEIFKKGKLEQALWFQKTKETDGILDVSNEQVKRHMNIIDLTEYDLKLIRVS